MFFFVPPGQWAYSYIISSVGVVSGTPHPAVWDTQLRIYHHRLNSEHPDVFSFN